MNDKKEGMKSCLFDIDEQVVWLKSANDLLAATHVANAHGELGQEALCALTKLYETIVEELEACLCALGDCLKEEDE